MYRTNHFDAGDFSVFHFGDPEAEIGKVCACACAWLSACFFQLPEKNVQQRVVFMFTGNAQTEQPVDVPDLLPCPEDGLVRFVERSKEKFPCGKQDRDSYYADQTVERRGVVDDHLACDGEQQYFKHGDRCVQIEHPDQFHADDQVKAGCEQVVIVRIGVQIRELPDGEDQLSDHDDDPAGQHDGDDKFHDLRQFL